MPPDGFEVPPNVRKLLNKLTVSQIAELSNTSKAYVSQVKHGKRPPSQRLLQSLLIFKGQRSSYSGLDIIRAIDLFLKSRRDGLSVRTIEFYRVYLSKAIPALGLTPTPRAVNAFLASLSCSEGGKHAYFRAIRAFYRWLYSPKSGLKLADKANLMDFVEAPLVPKLILPSLQREQVHILIEATPSIRGKAIIALFTESGLRLSELANIKLVDIDWHKRTVKVLGKGNREGHAPFGDLSERYLKAWLSQFEPSGGNIWGLSK